MRVAVLGAGGTIAPAVVRDLAESDEVTELLLLDLDAERALAVAERHGGDKAFAQGVDAREGLSEALEDSFVLVNSASYRINLDAMRACLKAGCHYVDLGGLYHVTAQQLELHDDFDRAGLLALLGMGSSPGKTNVMGVRALRELGAAPEQMEVVAASRDLDPPDGPSYPYAVQTLLDEITMSPMVVRDGAPSEVAPLTAGGEVDVGEPIGLADTIYTLHSEVLTFPDSFGCRACSFRLSLAPALLERLEALAGAPEPEVERAAREALPPSAGTVSVHVVTADDVRVTAVTEPMERWGLGGGIVSTAAPAAAAVRLMGRGKITATGALPPERCVDPDDLFPELETRNCRFSVEVKALG